MIVIIGAGLTGLSTAYHLDNSNYLIFEKEVEAGGLCRSVKKDGFIFDYTGHFLHLRNLYTEEFVKKFLPEGLNRIKRRAFIYLQGRYIPYPFQVHTYSLPPQIRKECVMGFIEAQNQRGSEPQNYLEWILQTFGEGMAKYFFLPYNEKFWQLNLSELTHEWALLSNPKPTLKEVLKGAVGYHFGHMGYNPTFFYPRGGGIELLTRAIYSQVKNVKLGMEVKKISLSEKSVLLENGEELPYQTLISTVPLPELLKLIEDIPLTLKKSGQQLRYLSVINLNLGIARDNVSDCHWIYFPEKKFLFYRVGFFSNISYALAPPHTSSLYVEITHLPPVTQNDKSMTEKKDLLKEINEINLLKLVLKGLIECEILKLSDDLITAHLLYIPYAYVVFDRFRKENLSLILNFLKKHGIFSIGRYGRWEYSTMEDAILQGKLAAEEVNSNAK